MRTDTHPRLLWWSPQSNGDQALCGGQEVLRVVKKEHLKEVDQILDFVFNSGNFDVDYTYERFIPGS
jgi:hypothetical protein